MLLARAHVVRSPFVYVAIGLPERLVRLGSRRMEGIYARALGAASTIVAYSEHEADVVRRWLRDRGVDAAVEFVPFGVDAEAFRPTGAPPTVDVVSVGADPHRDFELLLELARTMPATSFLVVTTAERARALDDRPANVAIETDVPFDAMRDRLERARVVALPVRENSYSGATTVLLQAMALAKPVVVTRTAAIAAGYGLVDGENLRFAAPGDTAGFGRSLADLLRDEGGARALGAARTGDGGGPARLGALRRAVVLPRRRSRTRPRRHAGPLAFRRAPEGHRACRAAHRAGRGRRAFAPRPTSCARAAATPTSRSSTSSRPRRPEAGTSSSAR